MRGIRRLKFMSKEFEEFKEIQEYEHSSQEALIG
jgi:hypothetical protein